jgi:hypothetical protein
MGTSTPSQDLSPAWLKHTVTSAERYSMERAEALELLAAEAYDDGALTEVIRPAAVLPEDAARTILAELAINDVRNGGRWLAQPSVWRRYDRSWDAGDSAGGAQMLGSIQVAYGTPTRYEITVFRVTVTREGAARGLSVESLCDEAFGFGGLRLANCPRADLSPPPRPFRFS